MSGSTSYTTIKDELLEELDKVPEDALSQILAYVRSQFSSSDVDVVSGETSGFEFAASDEAKKAYMASEKEYEDVYRRLADS